MNQAFFCSYFLFTGCSELPVTLTPRPENKIEDQFPISLIVPDDLNENPIDFQDYRQDTPKSPLALPTETNSVTILKAVRYPFRVLYPHQYVEYVINDAFFLQDSKRTFLARCQRVYIREEQFDDNPYLDAIDLVSRSIPYANVVDPLIDPVPAESVSLGSLQSRRQLGVVEGGSL